MEKLEPGKSPFTTVHHIGAIVRDADKLAAVLESLGMGPFNSFSVTVKERIIYGKRSEDFKARSRQTHAGQVRLELVQPIAGKSPQMDFLDERGEGLHHIAFLVSNIDEVEAETVKKTGLGVTFRSRYLNGGATTYFDSDKVGGIVFELFQRPSDYVPHE